MDIISIIITILSIFIPGYRKKRERIKNTYKIIWRKSSKLEPEDLFNLTSYKINKFYYPRKYLDKSISENIENNKNLLVIGPPLSGKTRTLYQNLKRLKRNVDIIIPFKKDIDFFYDL